jgi:hypothetical protein
VDARQARHLDEILAQDLLPERLDRRILGEEAMAADVEAEPLYCAVREMPPTMSSRSSTVTR